MKKLLSILFLTSCATLAQAESNANAASPVPSHTQSQAGQYRGQPLRSQYQGGQHNYQGNSYQSSYQGYSGQNHGVVDDQQLFSKIQSAINLSPKFNKVTATVNNGVVTLQGTVNAQEDIQELGSIVGGIDGVKSVMNQVRVAGADNYSGSSQSYGSGYQGSGSYPSSTKSQGSMKPAPTPSSPSPARGMSGNK